MPSLLSRRESEDLLNMTCNHIGTAPYRSLFLVKSSIFGLCSAARTTGRCSLVKRDHVDPAGC